MGLRERFSGFVRKDAGAVAADWVILSAAVIGCGVAVTAAVQAGRLDVEAQIAATMDIASALAREVFDLDQVHCPTVVAEGPISAWTEPARCNAEGQCTAPQLRIVASYRLHDGSDWTMTVARSEGEEAQIAWYDADGAAVDAPCFAD